MIFGLEIVLILTAIVYLLGGVFILFVYETYEKTKQTNLLILTIGLFILIFGSNFDVLAGLLLPGMTHEFARTIALIIEIPGILIMLYSVLK
ncbi:MAG: hypothetical protein K0A89_04755 [ANME-2 cluster archaeon]|nr:hypothetical protein [ANME-2 cluster archaeon]MCL7476477.1 hypothetical protein [ANME-2 cluster archaeon]